MNRLFTALLLLFVATLPAGSQPVPGSCSALAPCYVLTTASATTPVAGAQMGLGVVTATSLTVPATARVAQIVIEGQSVRCRDDGTAPTAAVGTLYPVGAIVVEWVTGLSALQCIQTTATATLDVAYYK